MEFNLGIEELFVVDAGCEVQSTGKSCKSATKMDAKATGSKVVNKKQTMNFMEYGFDLVTKSYTNQVCLGNVACTPPTQTFRSIEVENAPFTGFDGILGLAPSSLSLLNSFTQDGKSFQNQFGIHVNGRRTDGHFTFGGFDTDLMVNSTNVTVVALHEDQTWGFEVKGLNYGGVDVYSSKHKRAELFLSQEFVELPADDFANLQAQFEAKGLKAVGTAPGEYQLDGKAKLSDLPNLSFTVYCLRLEKLMDISMPP